MLCESSFEVNKLVLPLLIQGEPNGTKCMKVGVVNMNTCLFIPHICRRLFCVHGVVTGSTENSSRDRLRGINAPKNTGFSGIGRFAGVDDCSISKFL